MGSVSHSEVDSYLLCRRKHYYGYTLGLERVNTSDSLATGSLGHKVLEAFYKKILEAGDTLELQKNAWDVGLAAALATYEQAVKEGYESPDNRHDFLEVLFNETYGYFATEPYVGHDLICAVEMKFSLEYDEVNESRYPFVVDLIVKTKAGDFVVVDHKFVYDFYTIDASLLQPQIPKYIGALRGLNYAIAYGQYNMVRTRKIKAPTVDQMHQTLDVKPNTTRVVRTFQEQLEVATEVQALKELSVEEQEKRAWRVANKMICQSCSFKDLCISDLIGGNSKLLMKTEYKKRERKEFVVSEEAEAS